MWYNFGAGKVVLLFSIYSGNKSITKILGEKKKSGNSPIFKQKPDLV